MDIYTGAYLETFQMIAVFIALTAALYFYATEKISIELTSIWVLLFLMGFFYVFPVYNDTGSPTLTVNSLLAGFSNPALITVFSLMIIGKALSETGALKSLSSKLLGFNKNKPVITMTIALLLVGFLSAFLNNVPMVIVFIPVIVTLTKRLRVSPTRWLMPFSFITILGGMTTIVGSSTNLLVSGAIESAGEEPFSFFSFTQLGFVMALTGGLYVLFILPRILPNKKPLKSQRQDVDEISPLSEQTINGLNIPGYDADVLVIKRKNQIYTRPFDEQILAKIIVPSNSQFVGKTLRNARLDLRRNLTPVGLERNTGILQNGIMDISLKVGDVLLVVGEREDITGIMHDSDFILVKSSAENVLHRHHVVHTLAVFGITIAVAASGILPVPIATFLGAILMISFRCISFNEALKSVDKRILLLITTSLAIGLSLQETGGAQAIASNILYLFERFSPSVILSVFFLLVMIMTNILSNQATAVIFTPIAISLAKNLGVDINAFTFAVVFAANCCFVTPLAYQTNLLVMTPGQYSFKDFFKAGLPLAILLWAVYSIIAPIYFNF